MSAVKADRDEEDHAGGCVFSDVLLWKNGFAKRVRGERWN